MDQDNLYREIEYFRVHFLKSPNIMIGKETIRYMFHLSERQMEESKRHVGLFGCNTVIAEFSFGFILY